LGLVTIGRPEEPWAVFAQPELPLPGIEGLDAIQSVELWLARHEGGGDDLSVLTAQLYLADAETRLLRARRWLLVRNIDERCIHSWGVLHHGGPESVWLLDEAARALVGGLWLAALFCSHSVCERHLAGLVGLDDQQQDQSRTLWGLGRLLEEADRRGILPADLREPLNRMNEARKASAHFRPLAYDGSLLRRAMAKDDGHAMESLEELAETDAFEAYETARLLICRVGL